MYERTCANCPCNNQHLVLKFWAKNSLVGFIFENICISLSLLTQKPLFYVRLKEVSFIDIFNPVCASFCKTFSKAFRFCLKPFLLKTCTATMTPIFYQTD